MRKLIVVLMAVLMLVSFTSCNQDKIDELEKEVKQKEAEIAQKEAEKETFTEFVEAFQSVMVVEDAYETVLYNSKDSTYRTSPIDVHYTSAVDSVQPKFIGDGWNGVWIGLQALAKNPDISSIKEVKTSGTVTYEETPTKTNFAYKIVKNEVSVECELKDSEETATVKLDIDGSLSCKTAVDSASNSATVTVAFNGNICGEDIDISFTVSMTTNEYPEFTAAKINGKDVNLILLNNVVDGMVPVSLLTELFQG